MQLRAQALRRRAVDRLLHENVAEAERAVAARPHEAAAGERLRGACRRSARRPDRAARRRRRRVNSFPTTAPRSSTARSPGPSRSRRAASSAWIVSGSARSVSPPSSASARSCSRKSGLPSAASTTRARWSDSRIVAAEARRAARPSRPPRARRAAIAVGVRASFEERRTVFEELLAREADDGDRSRRPCPRGARRARGTSARPSGRRRRRGRAAARARSPRRTGGRARRSRAPAAASRRRARRGRRRARRSPPACAEHLAQRPVRDAVAVGEAATPERRDALRAACQLGGEPRLPDPRRSRSTNATRAVAPSTARLSDLRSAASSRLRPTRGASAPLERRRDRRSSSTSRNACTGSRLPLISSAPSGSRRAAWSIRRAASSPTTIVVRVGRLPRASTRSRPPLR